MFKLLIVDDEEKIRRIVVKYATLENYTVYEASNGLEAIKIVEQENIDLVILDIMMPEMDGFTTCKHIKNIVDIPILMLSARGEEYDKIHGFDLGVDDYIMKPFSPKELMLRVKAVLNRTHKIKHATYEYNDFKIDFTSRSVSVSDISINLSPKEYDLLFYLVQNQGIAIEREQIINKVWGYDYYGDDRTLDTHIKLLRKKIEPYGNLIITLRGVGYRFENK